jgi:hypothetical protein
MDPLFWIAIVMMASGVLGGLVNFYTADASHEKALTWWQHVFVGIVAAYIVPLFLSMASGDLIEKIRGVDGKAPDYSRLFVLAGFCLVAAASSRAFIRSLSDRLLQEVRAANRKADEAIEQAADAQAAVAPFVEDEQPGTARKSSDEGTSRDIGPPTVGKHADLSDEEKEVLRAMATSRFSLRSITGIAEESSLDKAIVGMALSSLSAKQLVNQAKLSKSSDARWSLSSIGTAAARDI